MSATSPVIILEPRATSRQDDVRATVFRLAFRRRLWRAVSWTTYSTSMALALVCLLGTVDYLLLLPRAVRVAVVALILCTLLLSFALAFWQLLRRPSLTSAAREIERAAGSRRNVLVTLCENLESMAIADGAAYMLARLYGQAQAEMAAIDESRIAPRREAARGALALSFVLLLVLGLRVIAPTAFALEARRVLWLASDETAARPSGPSGANMNEMGGIIAIEELRVRVVPPAYTGLGAEESQDDAAVRTLAGSEIEVTLRASGTVSGATLNFNGEAAAMRAEGKGRFSGSFVATTSGALEARVLADDALLAPAPIVCAVEVYADAPPEAHITEPNGDQLLRSVPAEAINVRWTARDDLGLAGARLKYIKSRGEGDAAKFTSGEISLGGIEQASAREWRGAAALDLARLGMQPGDTLVFWIEARDRNPSANNMGRSASLAINIRAPEAARLNLSDLLPNEIGRFLLSQRQIIIKTEKLHSERARLVRDEFIKRANEIAADQREFKNSFNDYIKTEGEAHEEEAGAGRSDAGVEERVRAAEDERTATHYHGIPEPPQGAPASVREMVYAIRAMWDAEDALSAGDTTKALVHEREALARLKRAQTAVRYIPPIVARSKPVDLKRRYAGELAEIKTRLEKLARRPQSKEALMLRAALADVYAALGDLQGTLNVPAGARGSATTRARERSMQAADHLARTGGDHAATIAEALGQLRIVETELARLEKGGTTAEYSARLAKPLALLTQAAANLFAIAESNTRAGSSEAGRLLPTDDTRAAEYFRRLGSSQPR
ncbi:MAG: hypothetical protein ICV68_00765 [Pyrinomonadaceae bacterium]|nr:hypothetical protein [Pyrinomonadaceae bacterium]